MDVEVERRMTQLMIDIDGVGDERTKKPAQKKTFKIEEKEDNFKLNPQ
jgi:hypothetical protein